MTQVQQEIKENLAFDELLMKKIKEALVAIDLSYGDSVYVVELKNNVPERFAIKCPVCGGKGLITHNGFEIRCSYCQDGLNRSNADLFLYEYVIRKYIINSVKVEIWGEEINVFFSKKKPPRYRVNLKAFHREGNAYKDTRIMDVPTNINDERTLGNVDTVLLGGGTLTDTFCLLSKKNAEEVLSKIVAWQRKQLDGFNEKYKTDYAYPFEEK